MNFPQIPKCHRKYNIAYTAFTSDVAMADHDQCGFHSRDYDILQTKLNEELRSNRKVVIMTRGRRFQQHACRTSRNTVTINCEDIYDPDQDVNLRSHVGWHHGILENAEQGGQVHPTSQQHPGVRHSAGGWQQSVGGPRVQVRPP